MDDVIEFGLEGMDAMVDKHFDKIPCAAFDHHTYDPRNLRKASRRASSMNPPNNPDEALNAKSKLKKKTDKDDPRTRGADEDRGGGGDRDRDRDRFADGHYAYQEKGRNGDRRRGGFDARDQNDNASYVPYVAPIPQIYSNQPPRPQRYAPPDYGSQDDYAPRSAPSMTRRGSSQPDLYRGRQRGDGYNSEDGSSQPDRRVQRRRDEAEIQDLEKIIQKEKGKDVKDKKHGVDLTGTSEGLIGAGLGAALGGLIAAKAQGMSGGKGKKKPDDLLTLLGAAVGSLAVNAAVDRWEDTKKEKSGNSRNRGRGRESRQG